MAGLGTDAWTRLMVEPTERDNFWAERDNIGAFATGDHANARIIHVGPLGNYIENFHGSTSNSAPLESFIPNEYQEFVIENYKYNLRTVDVALIGKERNSKQQRGSDGSIITVERLLLHFRGKDGHIFTEHWPDSTFPYPLHYWLTFLIIKHNEKEQTKSFYLQSGSRHWYAWPSDGTSVPIPISRQKFFVITSSFLLAVFLMAISKYFRIYATVDLVPLVCVAIIGIHIFKYEQRKLERAIVRAQQAIEFRQL